jgi:hypothetical protein
MRNPLTIVGSVDVIGTIWMPAVTAASSISLSSYDVENMRNPDDGKIARNDIEQWLYTHTGDFQSIEDFRAEIGNAVYGWKSEESEFTFSDCMYPSEDY